VAETGAGLGKAFDLLPDTKSRLSMKLMALEEPDLEPL
jgi:hypothetical protein